MTMLRKVKQMKRYLRSKLGDVPIYVTLTLWDDGDYEIIVRHTQEDHTQHNIIYHHRSKRLDHFLSDANPVIVRSQIFKGFIPISAEDVFGKESE